MTAAPSSTFRFTAARTSSGVVTRTASCGWAGGGESRCGPARNSRGIGRPPSDRAAARAVVGRDLGAGVAEGGDAVAEEDARAFVAVVDVEVGVDQPRQQRQPRGVHHRSPVRHADRRPRPGRDDPVAPDDHGRIRHRRRARSVDERRADDRHDVVARGRGLVVHFPQGARRVPRPPRRPRRDGGGRDAPTGQRRQRDEPRRPSQERPIHRTSASFHRARPARRRRAGPRHATLQNPPAGCSTPGRFRGGNSLRLIPPRPYHGAA